MRKKSGKESKNGGWVFHLDKPIDTSPLSADRRKETLTDTERDRIWRRVLDEYRTPEQHRVRDLAIDWGVSLKSLNELGIVWGRMFGKECWMLPQHNSDGKVVGVLRRFTDGKRFYVRGSRPGLHYGFEPNRGGPVLLVEGASDTAAAITMGLGAIGRPSNVGGVRDLSAIIMGDVYRKMIVLGENDRKRHAELKPDAQERHNPRCRCCRLCWPGKSGALYVAAQLNDRLSRGPWKGTISVKMPPAGAKDLREWLNRHGQNPEDAEEMAALGKLFLEELR